MSNVKVAIRVRPFTEKELKSDKNHDSVIDIIDEKTITITNIKVSLSGAGDSRERLRRYQADYVFDSISPASPNYASQDKVFQTVGQQVLGSISNGISSCVLAYGQSATGKTYTMMGTEANPGFIPRLCLAFADFEPLDLTVSFFEIYNERVHDLLASEVLPCNSLPRHRGNTRKDLRVREHPTKGPYVQNLRRVAVHDVESLLSIVREGKRQRRSAATKRNCNSSRSHALLEISTSRATLRLVDLAGSEKAGQEGNGGCRQKEGSNINKSLVALSNVISALVRDGGRGRFVPYRNSALTLLLKECLIGGSSIFIIATISPSYSCFNETASTLRWLARARYIPATSPHNKIILTTKSVLQVQYNQLLSELTKHYIRYIPETGHILFDDKHWNLNIEKDKRNIGNIMDNFSKTNSNFESPIHTALVDVGDSNDKRHNTNSRRSDLITKIDKQGIAKEINNEIDHLLGAPLARSGTDVDMIVSTKHERKYSSHEVLSPEKIEKSQLNRNNLSDTSLSEEGLDKMKHNKIVKPPISILYDKNQRAEIVASVTERLYSKLKNNEAVDLKPETVLDRKIVQPMNELKICTNARQRLMEISQKAIRNRRRIGIPAYTQTRKNIIRVKDQSIDVQKELMSYRKSELNNIELSSCRDVSTETKSLIPRYKEVATGSDYGTIFRKDNFTMTEYNKKVYKESGTMTTKNNTERCTQTWNVSKPPKKKKRPLLSRYLKYFEKKSTSNSPSIININISSLNNQESETQHSDDSRKRNLECKISHPDLLNNYGIQSKQKETIPINQGRSSDDESSSCDIQVEALGVITDDDSDSSGIFILPKPVTCNTDIKNNESKINICSYENEISQNEENNYKRSLKYSDTENKIRPDIKFKQSVRYVDTDDSTNSEEGENFSLRKSKDASSTNRIFETAKTNLYSEFLRSRKENDVDDVSCCSLNNSASFNNNKGWKNKHQIDCFEKNYTETDTFENVESKIKHSCRKLESAANKYENYLNNYKKGGKTILRSPTEYLQHLIQIRKDLVKED